MSPAASEMKLMDRWSTSSEAGARFTRGAGLRVCETVELEEDMRVCICCTRARGREYIYGGVNVFQPPFLGIGWGLKYIYCTAVGRGLYASSTKPQGGGGGGRIHNRGGP